MAEELIYVYCIANKEPDFKTLGLNGTLYSVFHKDFCAVVSKVSADEFNEENLKKNLSDMNWLEQKVRKHMEVISRVMECDTVVPFKFGTLFNTEDNLKKMLGDCSQQFKDSMDRLKSKEEWSVKIYCDFKVLNEKISERSEALKDLDKQIFSSSKGRAFLLKKKRNELLGKEVDKKISEYGQHCFEKLKVCAVDTVINKLLPREVTEKKTGEMILNSVYLVAKEKVADFLKVVEELKNKYGEIGLEFDCSGPWPPYNFTGADK